VYLLFVLAAEAAAAGRAPSALQGATAILFHQEQYKGAAEAQVDHILVKD
jgi:hypothetical protein